MGKQTLIEELEKLQTAIGQNRAGMQCDVDSWHEILNLEIENEK